MDKVVIMKRINVLGFLFILLGIWLPLQAGTPTGDDKKFTLNEDCMECHDDIPDFTEKTLHGTAFKVDCTDCHGDNEEHLEDPLPENIIMPVGKSGEALCLTCHESGQTRGFSGHSSHGGKDMACSDCHQAHGTMKPPAHLLVEPAEKLCLSCHGELTVSLNKPYGHRLNHGGMTCLSCHPIHGDTDNPFGGSDFGRDDTCLSCHQGLQGPFVFEHVTGGTGTCMSCHQPHGSSNPKQLTRVRIADLCLECHSSSGDFGLGSQPPAIHDMRSPRYQNCTTCHTAVHGSHQSPLLLK